MLLAWSFCFSGALKTQRLCPEEGRREGKYNVASYQADHSFMSHKGMQLVPEKNKERGNLPPGFILSHASYRAAPAGPLNQCLHVPVLVTWNFLPSWALQIPCIAVWSTSLGRILLPAQTWLTQQQLRQGKWPQGRKNGEAGRL